MFITHRIFQRTFLLAAVLFLGIGTAVLLLTLPAAAEPSSLYITLHVDTLIDSNSAAYQQCTAAADDCSLRGAISAANANAPTPYRLVLPAGSLTLTLAGSGEDNNATGDLDIAATADVLIVGDAAGSIIQAGTDASNGIDRIFHVFGGLDLQNVTVRYGRVSDFGGGILDVGFLALTDVTLFANMAVNSRGGGLYVDGGGQAVITNGQILSNTADVSGGGLGIGTGTVTISGTQIISNSAAASGSGGGIFVWKLTSRLQINGGVLRGNDGSSGGGLFVESGTAVLTDTQIISNTALYGAGIRTNQPTAVLTATDVTLSGNNAAQSGGGLDAHNGAVNFSGGQIRHNNAINGGGLFVNQGSAALTNAQVVSNTAQYGGGAYLFASTAVFTAANTTLDENSAAYSGGGIFMKESTAVLSNTQILSNSAQLGAGGGLFLQYPTAVLTMTNGQVRDNTAHLDGGGLYLNNGQAVFSGIQLLDNRTMTANGRGGGIFSIYGQLQIGNSCIVNNSDTSVAVYNTGKQAVDNWWGAADGPAGDGPGSGDSVSSSADYSGFKTSAPAGCSYRLLPTADAGAPQTVNPGNTTLLDGAASTDAIGDGLIYVWTQTGGTAVTFTPTLSRTAFTAPSAAGVLTFTLAITDGLHRSDTAVTTVTVNHVVYLPLVAGGSGQTGTAVPSAAVPTREVETGRQLLRRWPTGLSKQRMMVSIP